MNDPTYLRAQTTWLNIHHVCIGTKVRLSRAWSTHESAFASGAAIYNWVYINQVAKIIDICNNRPGYYDCIEIRFSDGERLIVPFFVLEIIK